MLFKNQTSQFYTYEVTVPVSFQSDVLVLFYFDIADLSGNSDPFAYSELGTDPSRGGALIKLSGASLEEFIPYIVAFILIIVVFSFIAIKKFSGTELVGLDIEAVMENIQKMKHKDSDIKDSLDSHTLGVVISFFDQRHGPIPVMQDPPILRDNFEKLVELSDLSFSAVRFVDNFEDEIQASFDFTVDERTRVSSITHAFFS